MFSQFILDSLTDLFLAHQFLAATYFYFICLVTNNIAQVIICSHIKYELK